MRQRADKKPRDRCPGCGSGWIKRRHDTMIECHTCDHVFSEAQAVKVPDPKKRTRTSSGSGQIAGRVVIPTYHYGAGW
jgi:ribosomal protein L37AE/L43A